MQNCFLVILLLNSFLVFAQTQASEPKFVEISKGEFPSPEFVAGSSWVDYDNDGWLDLFINGDSTASDWLLQNNPPETFLNRKALSGLPNYGLSGAWGDYNNDGWADLFVAVGTESPASGASKNDRLYKNTGQGIFVKIEDSPIVKDQVNTQVGVWGDINRDGFVDLVVSTDGGFRKFTNTDGATFLDDDIGFASDIQSQLILSDIDHDGDLDLVAPPIGMTGPLIIRLNDGQKFNEVLDHTIEGLVVFVEDFDNDEKLELVAQDYTSKNIYEYDNNTKSFAKSIFDSNVGSDGRRLLAAADFDNNGLIDILLRTSRYYPIFFMNDGVQPNQPGLTYESFKRYGNTDILGIADAQTVAIADYNNDGWLDLFTMTTKGFSPLSHHLFRAVPGSNHWLRIKLKGVSSNRDGIGAKIMLHYGPGSQMREIKSNSSSLSGSELIAHFGLGKETIVSDLVIEWPSGSKQLVTNPTIDQLLTIEEENNITGIEESTSQNLLYPNPADSKIKIVSESILKTIRLITIQGVNLITINNIGLASYELPITNLSEGLYFLEINSSSGKEIKKLVVKR